MKPRANASFHRGFSLVELLVVIMIIAILMGLTIIGTQYAMSKSNENKTRMQLKTLETGIEKYYTERLEYPNPSVSGSKILYMALTGDGITGVDSYGKPIFGSPDGKLVAAEQARWPVYLEELVPTGSKSKGIQGWLNINTATGAFKDVNSPILDGFGESVQYKCTGKPPAGDRNTTYDLWSYGTDNTKSAAGEVKWIKNW